MAGRMTRRKAIKGSAIRQLATAALVLCSLLVAGPPALAASVITSSYYEDSPGEKGCSGFECTIAFAKVPKGKHVTIDGVACGLSITNGALQAAVLLQKVGQDISNGRTQPLSFDLKIGGSTKSYVISTTSRMRFAPGSRPVIRFASNSDNASWGLVCQISGSVD